jgi:hypothetical protein
MGYGGGSEGLQDGFYEQQRKVVGDVRGCREEVRGRGREHAETDMGRGRCRRAQIEMQATAAREQAWKWGLQAVRG